MIRLDLGEEPAALARARAAGLERAAAAADAQELKAALTGYGEPVRRELYARQGGKCAWCERPVGASGNPVDHVRPKLAAEDHGGRQAPEHYWWLTWTWTNLVFACEDCNSQHKKGNKAWMARGAPRLPAPARPAALPLPEAHFDVAAERSLLLHPRLEDPLLALKWVPVERSLPRPRWRWKPAGWDADGRGEATRELLRLDTLIDQVNTHLRTTAVEPDGDIRAHLAAGRQAEALELWDRAAARLRDPAQWFLAAQWWAWRALWPESDRVRHGLPALPRPEVRWRAG
jgi:hypothetical protein